MQKLMEPRGAAQGTATKPSGNTDRSHEAMLSNLAAEAHFGERLPETPETVPGALTKRTSRFGLRNRQTLRKRAVESDVHRKILGAESQAFALSKMARA